MYVWYIWEVSLLFLKEFLSLSLSFSLLDYKFLLQIDFFFGSPHYRHCWRCYFSLLLYLLFLFLFNEGQRPCFYYFVVFVVVVVFIIFREPSHYSRAFKCSRLYYPYVTDFINVILQGVQVST